MEIKTLQDRYENLKARLQKKRGTLVKKENLLLKKKDLAEKGGHPYTEEEWLKARNAQDQETLWLFIDIQYLEEDVKRLEKEIGEIEAQLPIYEEKISKQSTVEDMYEKKVPEILKDLEKELCTRWDEWDIRKRNKIRDDHKNLPFETYNRKYSVYERRILQYRTDEEIHKDNAKDSKAFVKNLYLRVEHITGEVTSWSDIQLTQGSRGIPTLNGIVNGVQGRCKVESILASGPVQRLHVRVLTKEIN